MATEQRNQITLRLEGSRAERGVSLSDFESFIDSFLAALRDFDRDRRGAPTRKAGHPELRAKAVTAFRLIRFEPGSGIATLEPESPAVGDEEALPLLAEEVPPALENLQTLVEGVDSGAELSESVSQALAQACRVFGSDGSIQVHLPAHLGRRPVSIDLPRLKRLGRVENPEAEEVRSVSGRLHLLDVEPDKLAIRTSAGVDWTCNYPEELEPRVKQLVDRIVWAVGTGRLVTPQRGTMTIERIETIEQGEQTTLFTQEQIPDSELLERQAIGGPQGLDALSDPEWDEETDDAYLAALTGR